MSNKQFTYTQRARHLTERQLQMPFFRETFGVLSNALANRETILPELDRHPSGRKVRSEIHEAIEKLAEAILVRLDLATDTLGWVDHCGRMRLSNQSQLSADSGLSPAALSRFFGLLEERSYCCRRIEKLADKQRDGLWSVKTRTTITFTKLFFKHLGAKVYRAYVKAKKWAQKNRRKVDLPARRLAQQKEQQRTARAIKQAQNRRSFQAGQAKQRELEAKVQLARIAAEVGVDPAFKDKSLQQQNLEIQRRLLKQQAP